jgi:hypothetical protein
MTQNSGHQIDKFFYAQTSLPNNGAQCTAIKFFVIRHYHLRQRIIAPQVKPTLGQHFCAITA